MNRVYFLTFGCKVNHYETECLKSSFSESGYEIVNSADEADIAIINSCTVTSSGDSRAYNALKKIRREFPGIITVLTGCFPQAFPEDAGKIAEADIITGTKDRNGLVGLVTEYMKESGDKNRLISVGDHTPGDEFENCGHPRFGDNTRAFMKIQDGCDRYCSYCIIPYARGHFRSRDIESIRKEAIRFAEAGKKEIVLSGINLLYYGKGTDTDISDAVRICAGTDGIERVRLSSLEPEMMSDGLLHKLSLIPELCPHFHLSLQSGCTRTLKAMNRHYTAREYELLTEKIREYFPECSFTTDVMVGFPGETDEDFAESVDFVKKTGFSRVHVFRYSRRKGTVADKMSGQIPENIKALRHRIMTEAAGESAEEYMRGLVGRTVPVLFEKENSADFHHGYAPDYTLVKIKRENSEKSLRNRIICVKIEEYSGGCCVGTPVIPQTE